VSGPSSSGKTTTTVKLTQRLKKHGLHFLMLNLDDYFWSAIEHPTDWLNDRNYEALEALDIQLLNEHLRALLEGKPIEKPVYSFKEGRRVGTKTVKLEAGQILKWVAPVKKTTGSKGSAAVARVRPAVNATATAAAPARFTCPGPCR